MSQPNSGPCPVCGKTLRLPADCDGKKVKCSGCSTVLRIQATDDGLLLSPPAGSAPPPAAAGTRTPGRAPCPACGKDTVPTDAFCNRCGVDLAKAPTVVAPQAAKKSTTRHRRDGHARASRRNKILSAARFLLILAALFFVVGTIQGLVVRAEAQKIHANLDDRRQEEVIVADERMSVEEVLRTVDFEVAMTFGVNYLLGAIMIALFVWSRGSPFPAMLTALCVYVVVVVLGVILDPATLLKGLILKIVVITSLVGGMNAALAERTAARRALRS